MTHKEKEKLINDLPVIGYWDEGLNGHEVRKIEDTPDGIKFYIKANAGCSNPTYHIVRLIEHDTIDGLHKDHIRINNRRYYLKDCLRV